MYFNKKNKFLHGIMFHHFHDFKKHKKTQGSIDQNQFEKIIKNIGIKNILNPKEFLKYVKLGKLNQKKVCITFDDGLKSQYDVALRVLDKYNLKAFFFIFTSIFSGNPDYLEIYRYFRTNHYKKIDDFYNDFFSNSKTNLINFKNDNEIKIKEIKKKFPFYSTNDIIFRLIRDENLTKNEYDKIMKKMMLFKRFNYKKILENLYINKKNLNSLVNKGHLIGLHSHTHPTRIENFSKKKQIKEYKHNMINLNKFIKSKHQINSMSHPCGSYNPETLKILKNMKIELGFKQIMKVEKNKGMTKINSSNLEIARIDHALLT